MREHREHRGQETEGDVARDVPAAKAENGGRHQAEDTEEKRAEQRLRHARSMTDRFDGDPPSAFVAEWTSQLAPEVPLPRRALDVAVGRGRHLRALAEANLQIFGVDRNYEALRTARDRAGRAARLWCADLTVSHLPRGAFQLLLVARYLQRDLFPAIRDALTRDGILIYETFTVRQRALGFGPTSADHLLEPEELRIRIQDAGFEILFYEEVTAPEAVARLAGRRY
jgi:hypothetical protein